MENKGEKPVPTPRQKNPIPQKKPVPTPRIKEKADFYKSKYTIGKYLRSWQ